MYSNTFIEVLTVLEVLIQPKQQCVVFDFKLTWFKIVIAKIAIIILTHLQL